ncbi:tyrosine-type recombinase/integrase [Dehalobacter sp.]|uniref:tyrosine-type recombinase/integrase n=1 Tax=Dehalobacter sp. TaxID=1962289 RepID=UPI00258A67DB|nr:tyrosine-type recombinase/integrase [Dehalobacter sp.]MDJ0305102.1 tyrosine-type recombinase/integrase [Dehalobacter sp.]
MSRKRKGNIIRNINWEEGLVQFLSEKAAQGRSERTLKDYDYHVRQFYHRYAEGDLKTNLYKYLAEKCAPATFNLRLVYLKAYFKWVAEQGFLEENPLESITRRKAEPRIVQIDSSVLARLISLPDINTYAGLRDKALICLTLDTGIRPKEACNLSVSDFNSKMLEVIVPADIAKTRKQRTLPISQLTCSLIARLISVRPTEWAKDVVLFASADGTTLNKNTWGDRLEHYSTIIGVKIRPYDLRHAFALGFLRNGGNALFLQRIMGHTDLNMTKRYVAATDEDLRNALTSASPLARLVKPKRIINIHEK